MEEKNEQGRMETVDSALEAGYRMSRTVGTAIRRADEATTLPVRNELNLVSDCLEGALFALEEVRGVRGSVGDCLGDCSEFVARYREALEEIDLDRRTLGTLNDGLGDAVAALDGLRFIVDGYHSFGEDDTERG